MTLSSLRIFSSLPGNEIKNLEKVSSERAYGDGEFIFFQDDLPERFIVIIEGRVRVLKQSSTGKEVILEILGPGDPVGAVAVLDKVPFPASAQAMGDVRVLTTGKDAFLSIAERYPAFVKDLFLYIRRRLRAAREAVPSMTGEQVEQRIASTLTRLADAEGSGLSGCRLTLSVVLTRSDIARMVDSTVETVIRIMSRWEKEGLISSQRGKPLVILDIKRLKKLSGN